MRLSGEIARMEPFEPPSDGSDLPVFAFRIRDESAGFTVFDLSERLRTRGWIVPAYTFPADLEHVAVPGWWSATISAKNLATSSSATSSGMSASWPPTRAATCHWPPRTSGSCSRTDHTALITGGGWAQGGSPVPGRTTRRSRRAPARPAARPAGPPA